MGDHRYVWMQQFMHYLAGDAENNLTCKYVFQVYIV